MIMSAPASSSTSPSGQKSRRHGLWGLLPFIAAVGILALALLERQVFSFGPPCVFHHVTGLNCPGCGGTRAFFALVHGDLLRSIRYNPMTLLLLLGLGFWLLRSSVRLVSPGHRWGKPPVVSERLIWWVAGLVVFFGILRNLPYWPFTLLAPPV
jgi:hypothetical protein